eukprot:GABV01009539.1.p1 GENE.GABV01009539.1~~GABV01009539.1.p1  ORF type:complete len:109 (+),score=32.76 GABV01009539.1:68-394(+)
MSIVSSSTKFLPAAKLLLQSNALEPIERCVEAHSGSLRLALSKLAAKHWMTTSVTGAKFNTDGENSDAKNTKRSRSNAIWASSGSSREKNFEGNRLIKASLVLKTTRS